MCYISKNRPAGAGTAFRANNSVMRKNHGSDLLYNLHRIRVRLTSLPIDCLPFTLSSKYNLQDEEGIFKSSSKY